MAPITIAFRSSSTGSKRTPVHSLCMLVRGLLVLWDSVERKDKMEWVMEIVQGLLHVIMTVNGELFVLSAKDETGTV